MSLVMSAGLTVKSSRGSVALGVEVADVVIEGCVVIATVGVCVLTAMEQSEPVKYVVVLSCKVGHTCTCVVC